MFSLNADAMLVFTASCDTGSPSSPPSGDDFGGATPAGTASPTPSRHTTTPSTPTQPKFFLNLQSPPLSPSSASTHRSHLASPPGDASSTTSPLGATTPTPLVTQPVALLCHRAILSVRSPFFKSIIKRRLKAKGKRWNCADIPLSIL